MRSWNVELNWNVSLNLSLNLNQRKMASHSRRKSEVSVCHSGNACVPQYTHCTPLFRPHTELLERIQSRQRFVGNAKKRKKAKIMRKSLKAKRTRSSSSEQTADNVLVVTKSNSQDDDARYEAQFRRFLLPNLSPCIRCDTMANFPSAFTHCLNSGNFHGLSDLFRSSLDRRCDLRLFSGVGSLSYESFFCFFELMNDIHPDRIMCVNTTNVVNNQVTAALYTKYTDCKALYQAVARTVIDPALFRIVPATRRQCASLLQLENLLHHSEDPQKLATLIDSDSDLVMYGWVYVTVQFDDIVRKATSFHMAANLTSAHVADATR